MIINHQTMNIKTNILSALLALSFLYGCSAEDSMIDIPSIPSSEQEQAQVVLSISVPEVSLPLSSSTRTITDDKAIEHLAIWAFDENNRFLYQLTSDEKDEKGNHKIVQRENTIYALLPKSDTNVTLALIANSNNITPPSIGTAMTTAEDGLIFEFTEEMNRIPMYGKSEPFVVKEGTKPGKIQLKRAMAKLEIDASSALPYFNLEEVTVVNVNKEGKIVASQTITNRGGTSRYTTKAIDNKWVFYIPEATDINKKDTRVSLIMKGTNKKELDGGTISRYYRLDFIKRGITLVSDNEEGLSIEYNYIHSIERNKRYAFKIEHIAPATGSETPEKAISKDKADNAITTGTLLTIDDEEIRDITTDSEYYLGITQSDLTASMSAGGDHLYYVVNLSIITNNTEGWQIDTVPLPEGVSVNMTSYKGEKEKAASVWVYIDRTFYNIGDTVQLYVYSGNIRKLVNITITG